MVQERPVTIPVDLDTKPSDQKIEETKKKFQKLRDAAKSVLQGIGISIGTDLANIAGKALKDIAIFAGAGEIETLISARKRQRALDIVKQTPELAAGLSPEQLDKVIRNIEKSVDLEVRGTTEIERQESILATALAELTKALERQTKATEDNTGANNDIPGRPGKGR